MAIRAVINSAFSYTLTAKWAFGDSRATGTPRLLKTRLVIRRIRDRNGLAKTEPESLKIDHGPPPLTRRVNGGRNPPARERPQEALVFLPSGRERGRGPDRRHGTRTGCRRTGTTWSQGPRKKKEKKTQSYLDPLATCIRNTPTNNRKITPNSYSQDGVAKTKTPYKKIKSCR